MENNIEILKAIAEETRYNIIILLLNHEYCVSGLADRLDLSEAAISQHIKILKEAGLLYGEKRGYFMHYYVDSTQLKSLIKQIETLLTFQRKPCRPEDAQCKKLRRQRCLPQSKSINKARKWRDIHTQK